jgi:hypothetical protein
MNVEGFNSLILIAKARVRVYKTSASLMLLICLVEKRIKYRFLVIFKATTIFCHQDVGYEG